MHFKSISKMLSCLLHLKINQLFEKVLGNSKKYKYIYMYMYKVIILCTSLTMEHKFTSFIVIREVNKIITN